MRLEKAEYDNLEKIVSMSKKAFETDIEVGGESVGGPPHYDSINWHRQMLNEGHLYQALVGDAIVGGAILFFGKNGESLYIGRIFVDSMHHRIGYGIRLMECIENLSSKVKSINLDTPIWNVRTNSFYKKLGYAVVKEDDEFVYYKKEII